MKEITRLPIAHLPTAVESLSRLSEVFHGPTLIVKRDDQTGLAFGGNKTRKLETLAADAKAKNARTLLTAGAIQSNHCRQTAAIAARLGLECMLILSGEEPRIPTANLLIDHLLGAKIIWTTREERDQTLINTYEKAEAEGKMPYLIPYGGSNPIGASAYALAIQELLTQGQHPDWIVFASSSGGTQSGMVLGARIFGYQGKILGISVDEEAAVLRERVADLASQTAKYLEVSETFSSKDILVNDSYLGKGYAIMGAPEREAIHFFAQYEGLLVDPVYTGRAAAGLIDLIRKGFFAPHETVLFWHTGGMPALFAETYGTELL